MGFLRRSSNSTSQGPASHQLAEARFEQALREANERLRVLPFDVRAAAYCIIAGEIHVAIVVPGGGGLREALELLPGPAPVREILDDVFGFAGVYICADYHTDQMWREAMGSGGWLSILPDELPSGVPVVRTARPQDVRLYGVQSELPAAGQLYVATQWLLTGNSVEASAERLRDVCAEVSWVSLPYQAVTHDGRAYFWNSGSFSEEWLLGKVAEPYAYAVVWDTEVEHVGDGHASIQIAGERLVAAARDGTMEFRVTEASGQSRRVRPAIQSVSG